MWLILDDCGGICALITYFIVVAVYFGFVRVGIWEEMHSQPWLAVLHFIIFQYNCFMIFMSHFKCMTTEPGVLPKERDGLQFKLLNESMQSLIRQVGLKMKNLEAEIRNELKQRADEGEVDAALGILKNAEDKSATSIEDLCTDEASDEEGVVSKLSVDGQRMRGFEKNIEKLLLQQINESKYFDENLKTNMEKHESEAIKNKFDRRIYELDIYRAILQKVEGFDYRYPKTREADFERSTDGTET